METKKNDNKSKIIENDAIERSTSPINQNETKVCYKHPDEVAVATCSNCGKYICQDCAESCAVVNEDNSTSYLCYDCCETLFKDQEKKLKKDTTKIAFQYALTIIGVLIGGGYGFSSGGVPLMIIFAAIGGAFLSAIRPIASALGEMIKGVIELGMGGSIMEAIFTFLTGIFKFLIVAFQCCIRTVSKLISYTKYLISANKAIKQTQQALQQLADFMEYMEIREKSKNFDLDSLLSDEGSTLFNNSYARALRDGGEEKADQMLRQATTIIAENGEIIRNFAV